MYILGISAYYHDSAAVLIKDGQALFAVEEERFTRVKHDNSYPKNSIDFCLKSAGIVPKDISYIAYYEKPLLKFERILETFIATYPFSYLPFTKSLPEWLNEKIKVEQKIRKSLKFKGKIYFVPHHLSHAAASFYTSSFDKSAILTADGVGEYQTTVLSLGESNKITNLAQIVFPDSLGLLYSTFTAFLGFKVNEDEYKVMGMAAYGKPLYKGKIYETIDVKQDGSFKMNLSYFSFRESFRMWNSKFEKLLGSPRKAGSRANQRHKDIAASIQAVTEEIYFKMLNHLYSLTKTPNLCIGGGVGLNALANGKIYENTPFKRVYILGPSGDSGGALGAALIVSSLKNKEPKRIDNLYFGTPYSKEQIQQLLASLNLKYKIYSDRELVKKSAKLLAQGKILGWFQGKMEFGPRALGARSILASPFPFSMKDKVNRIKKREQFRPFAGSVLADQAENFFELPKTQKDFPFMNFCFQVRDTMENKIPAITHKDGTCRIQTVSGKNGLYYDLIKEFYKLTKVAVIMNTSFNLAGEPLVENPTQAINDFFRSGLDYLVIGNFILSNNKDL